MAWRAHARGASCRQLASSSSVGRTDRRTRNASRDTRLLPRTSVGRSVGRAVGRPIAVRTLSARSVRPSVRRGQRVTWERWTMATPIRRAAGARIQFLSLVPINRSRLLLANFQASVSWREIHANFLSKKANILLIGERRNAKTVLSI